MSADTLSIIHIRARALPKTIPDFFRHISISADPSIPCHPYFKQRTLGVIAYGVYVCAAKTKGCCHLIFSGFFVFNVPHKFHITSFLLYWQPMIFREDIRGSFLIPAFYFFPINNIALLYRGSCCFYEYCILAPIFIANYRLSEIVALFRLIYYNIQESASEEIRRCGQLRKGTLR